MNYTALYRKWRPARFEDVRGQDPIVKTLKNQLKYDRIGHAYLFSGTRGTGKTTLAKILARAVNCEHPVDGSPCNECASCRAILSGTSTNVVEIDAASNNGVDNIRELREEVKYRPTDGKYRVYIIDEVHMLTSGAFNALLKTLEEPPEYVIFILATTEANKIPITVLSRCQRYDFKRLTMLELTDQLRSILAAEHVDAEDKAVAYLARQADGSSRDALSLLERCISFGMGETLTYDRVLDTLGAVDQQVFTEMLKAVRKGSVSGVVGLLDAIMAAGREIGQFVTDFIWYLRNMLLLQTENPGAEVLGISNENLERMREEAVEMDLDETVRCIRILSELSNELRYAVSKRVLTELALIRMMQPATGSDELSLRNRIRQLEDQVSRLTNGTVVFEKDPKDVPQKSAAAEQKTVTLSPAVYEDYERLVRDWPDIVIEFSGMMRSLLQNTTVSADEKDRICLLFPSELSRNMYENNHGPAALSAFLQSRYQKEYRIVTRSLKPKEAPPAVQRSTRIPGIEMDIQGGI